MVKWADVYKANLEQGNVQGVPSDFPHVPLEISVQGEAEVKLFCERMNNIASLSRKRTDDMNSFIQWSCKLKELSDANMIAFTSEDKRLSTMASHAEKVAEYASEVQRAFISYENSQHHITRIKAEIEAAKSEGVNAARKLMGI